MIPLTIHPVRKIIYMLSLRFVFTHKNKSNNFYCYDIDNVIFYFITPNLMLLQDSSFHSNEMIFNIVIIKRLLENIFIFFSLSSIVYISF